MRARVLERLARIHGGRDGEIAARLRFFDASRDLTAHLSVAVGGCTYAVATADGGVSRDLFANGARPETVVLQRAMAVIGAPAPPRRTVVDTGANIGTSVIPALTVFGFERGVAVEPAPDNLCLLRMNIAANGLEGRIHVVGAAVSVPSDWQPKLLPASAMRELLESPRKTDVLALRK
jgi:hypothetical protein